MFYKPPYQYNIYKKGILVRRDSFKRQSASYTVLSLGINIGWYAFSKMLAVFQRHHVNFLNPFLTPDKTQNMSQRYLKLLLLEKVSVSISFFWKNRKWPWRVKDAGHLYVTLIRLFSSHTLAGDHRLSGHIFFWILKRPRENNKKKKNFGPWDIFFTKDLTEVL